MKKETKEKYGVVLRTMYREKTINIAELQRKHVVGGMFISALKELDIVKKAGKGFVKWIADAPTEQMVEDIGGWQSALAKEYADKRKVIVSTPYRELEAEPTKELVESHLAPTLNATFPSEVQSAIDVLKAYGVGRFFISYEPPVSRIDL